MQSSLSLSLLLFGIAAALLLPQVRTTLRNLALRRFFDDHMSRPRYRVQNLRPPADEIPPRR
jgi:hypothetical protein